MEIDAQGLEVPTRGQCLRLLRRRTIGRIVLTVDGFPAAFPVSYALLGDDIVFRSAAGTKLSAALDGATVGFQVDRIDPVLQTGWSVMVRGPASVITDSEELARAARLALRPGAPGDRPFYVRIRSDVVTGRRFPSPLHAMATTP